MQKKKIASFAVNLYFLFHKSIDNLVFFRSIIYKNEQGFLMNCINEFHLPNGEFVKLKEISLISEPKLNFKRFLLSFFKPSILTNYYEIIKKNGDTITIYEDDDLIRYKSLVHFMMVFEKKEYLKKRHLKDIND